MPRMSRIRRKARRRNHLGSPSLRLRAPFLAAGILMLGGGAAAAQSDMPDRSKPTNLYTTLETNAEWQSLSGGDRYGLRLMANLALSATHSLQVEVPFATAVYDGVPRATGFGDVRLRYFGVPYRRPESRLFAVGASVDLIAPVGAEEDGLGAGGWIVTPGIMAGLRLDDSGAWSLFGVLSYQHSTSEVNCSPGGSKPGCGVGSPPGSDPDSLSVKRGIRVESFVSAALPGNISGFLWPTLDLDLEARSTAFNVRINVEKMLTANHGLGVDLLREFVARDALRGHVRVSYIYVF